MKPETQAWTVEEESAGDRLDLFLVARLEGYSRASIQKAIKDTRILVNGKKAAVHKFLKKGDEVAYAVAIAKVEAPIATGKKERRKPVGSLKGLIIEETEDWMVIDKPAGLLSHPDAKTTEGTLIDLLIAHDPKIARVGEDPSRPGIVHRLDREVSGLMVIAKTQAAYESLKMQFAKHETVKKYLAFMYGVLPAEEGEIKFRIARSSSKARMAARPSHEKGGKAAWTHYQVRERFRGATLAEMEIFSGRTHQIRAHLHAMGCPVIGDELYAHRKVERNIKAPRLMLQSIELTFEDTKTGEKKDFKIAPVKEFDEVKTMLTT